MRQAARIDANHVEIVQALRQAGAGVLSLAQLGKGAPDLLVASQGRLHLIEIKHGRGKLNHDQFLWQRAWPAPVHTVRSPEEALQAIGLVKEPA